MTWYVYVARCSDNSLYCGIARDVLARIAEHDAGKGARYTRGRGPLTVLLVRRCRTHGNALRAEYAFKQLTRPQKERAITDPRTAGVYWRRWQYRTSPSSISVTGIREATGGKRSSAPSEKAS